MKYRFLVGAVAVCLMFGGCGNKSNDTGTTTTPNNLPDEAATVAEDTVEENTAIENTDLPGNTKSGEWSEDDEIAWLREITGETEAEQTQDPTVTNLCNQVFTKVSPFSEGLAWVQYKDDDRKTVTSVINTSGEVVFSVDRAVDYYSDFCDGYAFYLYTIDTVEQDKSLDSVAFCILDRDGNVTYASENDGVRIALAYGEGHFLVIEHISNFDTEEWRFGSIDQYGNTIIDFIKKPDFLSFPYDYKDYSNGFLSQYIYLGDGFFELSSRHLYNVREQKAFDFSVHALIRDGFQDGYMIYDTHGNSWTIFAISTSGDNIEFDQRSRFDRDEVFLSGYSEGVFFYDRAYYSIDGTVQINFPQYEGKLIAGGTFDEGYAPLYVQGADKKDYFTIIDSQGNELFEPIPGSPAYSFGEGYLAVQLDSGCALFNARGEKILEAPYNILGSMEAPDNHYANWYVGNISSKVSDGFFVVCKEGSSVPTVFVGIDGSYIGQ